MAIEFGAGVIIGGGPGNFTIGVANPPTYSVAASGGANSINEGSSLTVDVTTAYVDNGTTLYWTINNVTTSNTDFSPYNGSFTINNNTGSFSISPIADVTTEGSETCTVSVRTLSTSGTVVATSNSITVNDTSITPVYYSYQFSGTNSFVIYPPDPHQTSITGAMLWNAYQKGWTWEAWIKPTAGNSTRRLLFQYYYGNYSDSQHRIFLENTNEIVVFTGEQGYNLYDKGAGAYTVPLNSWTHVALVKQWPSPTNSGYPRISLYINGVKKRETYDHVWNNSDYGMTYQPYSRYDIGQDWGYSAGGSIDNYANSPFTGYISNMRITRNLAVYTGDFTVPTSPLGLTQSASTNIAAIDGGNDTGRVILLTCNDSSLKDNGYYNRTASFVAKGGGPAFVAQSPF
jgi:hypothetical protein